MKKRFYLFGGIFSIDVKKTIKALAVYVPAFGLWYRCTDFRMSDMPLWKEVLLCVAFYMAIDLIRWGLSKD